MSRELTNYRLVKKSRKVRQCCNCHATVPAGSQVIRGCYIGDVWDWRPMVIWICLGCNTPKTGITVEQS